MPAILAVISAIAVCAPGIPQIAVTMPPAKPPAVPPTIVSIVTEPPGHHVPRCGRHTRTPSAMPTTTKMAVAKALTMTPETTIHPTPAKTNPTKPGAGTGRRPHDDTPTASLPPWGHDPSIAMYAGSWGL